MQVDTSDDFGPSRANPATSSSASAGIGAPSATLPGQPASAGATAGVAVANAPVTPVTTTPSGPSAAGASAVAAAGSGGPSAAAAGGVAAAAGMGGSAGARSGVTIDLGDKTVAKEDVIAFIHVGHSNMAGRAFGPADARPYFFDETDPHAWMYHAGDPPALAKEPYTAGDDLSGTWGGPGTALLKQAVQMAPDKYFLSLGFGQTSAYCTQFLPGALYYDMLIAAPKAIKDRVTFGAIVIMLGITERHGTSADISGYSDCINKLVTAIRKDVGQPDLPLLITDYEQEASGMLAVSSSFARQIIPEIRKLPSVVSNSVLVPTDGLSMQDDHHFDFNGHKTWTKRVLDIMKEKGWFPWAK
jgi:hypothetical protein